MRRWWRKSNNRNSHLQTHNGFIFLLVSSHKLLCNLNRTHLVCSFYASLHWACCFQTRKPLHIVTQEEIIDHFWLSLFFPSQYFIIISPFINSTVRAFDVNPNEFWRQLSLILSWRSILRTSLHWKWKFSLFLMINTHRSFTFWKTSHFRRKREEKILAFHASIDSSISTNCFATNLSL